MSEVPPSVVGAWGLIFVAVAGVLCVIFLFGLYAFLGWFDKLLGRLEVWLQTRKEKE